MNNIYNFLIQKPAIIAGPCSVESKEQIEEIAASLSTMGIKFLRGGTYKPRTSPKSFQGLEAEGVEFLRLAADKHNMFTVTETLDTEQLDRNYDQIDVIQVGSRSMASYGYLKHIARKTMNDKKPILLKRGFAATLTEFLFAADYLSEHGNENIILCLRGIRTFEQGFSDMRFTPDLASILELKEKSQYPIFFDPSHSSGYAKFVIPLAKAALSLRADGLLIETHNHPENAMSDSKQAIHPEELKELL